MIINRYLAAILSAAVVLLGAFNAIPADAWSWGDPLVASFVALAASTVIAYLVPLAPGRWAGRWKTGVVILAGIFAAVWPLLDGGRVDWLIVIFAAVNALAQEIGVQIRVDDPALTATPVEAGRHVAS